ncbi:MAG: hypothetical protein ACFWT8_08350 [Lacticaseibacillus casei]
MNAYVNGYTIVSDKKYLVFERLGGKPDKRIIKPAAQAYHSSFFQDTVMWSIEEQENLSTLPTAKFTEEEIKRYGLQDYERVEIKQEEEK